jgi:hypothetical protein
VAARAAAFADPEVIRLASASFIPLAENCTPLQTQQDAKGAFFRLVAEQGHYAGRTVPSATRQGQYAFTAGGTLLASVNTRDAATLLGMMRQALERWEALTAHERGRDVDAGAYARDPRSPDRYPVGGLVLKQTLRDLPRPDGHPSPQSRPEAINFDYAWFTADEVRDFLPEAVRVGARRALPAPRRKASNARRSIASLKPATAPKSTRSAGKLGAFARSPFESRPSPSSHGSETRSGLPANADWEA